jgi:hypothetical protein
MSLDRTVSTERHPENQQIEPQATNLSNNTSVAAGGIGTSLAIQAGLEAGPVVVTGPHQFSLADMQAMPTR